MILKRKTWIAAAMAASLSTVAHAEIKVGFIGSLSS
ncbi:MAG: hypothetical protein ACJA0Z_002239, partial [Halioglobus sp.]